MLGRGVNGARIDSIEHGNTLPLTQKKTESSIQTFDTYFPESRGAHVFSRRTELRKVQKDATIGHAATKKFHR